MKRTFSFGAPHGYQVHVVCKVQNGKLFAGYSLASPAETKKTRKSIGFNIAEKRMRESYSEDVIVTSNGVICKIKGPSYKPYKATTISQELKEVKWAAETAIRMMFFGVVDSINSPPTHVCNSQLPDVAPGL